jgi:hypothetical protein
LDLGTWTCELGLGSLDLRTWIRGLGDLTLELELGSLDSRTWTWELGLEDLDLMNAWSGVNVVSDGDR